MVITMATRVIYGDMMRTRRRRVIVSPSRIPNSEAPASRPGLLCPMAGAAMRAQGSAARASVVPKRGLEPPRGCPHQTLNLACLPIPPLRRDARRKSRGDLTKRQWQVKDRPDVTSRMDNGPAPVVRYPTRMGATRRDRSTMKLREPSARRVLIVDDEEGFRDGVADLLGMEGYRVSVARDAVEAVKVLPEFRPEVILPDLR